MKKNSAYNGEKKDAYAKIVFSWTQQEGNMMRYFPGYEESHEQEMRTYFQNVGFMTLGRKCSGTFKNTKDKFIRHDDVRGEWNYLVDANGIIR
jgi:hypothetical protein